MKLNYKIVQIFSFFRKLDENALLVLFKCYSNVRSHAMNDLKITDMLNRMSVFLPTNFV